MVDTTNQAPAGARRVVLLGQGISYSASPAMQSAAFAAAGLNWRYEVLDVPPDGLAAAVEALREPLYAGANVTIPHKVAVMRLLDELEGDALAAGAVNTIRRDGARLVGSNTDVVGIRTALGSVGVEPLGAEVVVLGVGGTARAAAVALHGARLTFVARRPEAGAGLPGQVLSWDDPGWQARARHSDLIVNTTPLGRRGEMTIRPNFLPPRGAVIDLVYMTGGTPLVRRSRQLGLRCADGWGILVAQGAAAFQAWTGLPAPLDAMRAALDQG
ncbi:MAG: shikimate dehydrogenase [Candidatus Dormibacteraeota bacterium]|nr:shikimate dehydrogenase [Candidatus Dormibacteraeota bacterium]MBO0762528.1 shikimate dehydrogenase [Candidatus Dormibacteraeota bacterium]